MTELRKSDLVALALTPWAILLQGFRFGVGNHETILSFARRMSDANWLAGDWMMSTPAVHPLTTHLVAMLSGAIGESWAMLLIHAATRLLLFVAAGRLVFALNPGARAASAFVAMILVIAEPRLHVGGHYLHGATWESAHLGMALAVMLIAAVIRWQRGIDVRAGRPHHKLVAADDCGAGVPPAPEGNESAASQRWQDARAPLIAGLIGGATIIAHLFVGLPLVGVAVLAALVARRPMIETLAFLASAIIVGAAAWVPAARDFFAAQASGLQHDVFIAMLQWRHPWHHAPWTWPALELIEATAIVLLVAWLAWRRRQDACATFVALMAIYFIASCKAFWIFGEIRILPALALSQPFRIFSLFLALGACQVAPCLARTWNVGWVARFGAFASAILFRFIPIVTFVVPRFLARGADNAQTSEPAIRIKSGWVVGVFGVGAFFISLMQTLPPVAALANSVRHDHWLVTTEPTDATRAEMTEWIRANTAESALFAIPPELPAFRIWEERPVILDLKNFPYRSVDLNEWHRRYRAQMWLGERDPRNWPPADEAYFDGSTLNEILPRPDFAVIDKRTGTPKPPADWANVFENSDYLVVRRQQAR